MIELTIDKLNKELVEELQPLLEENHAVSGQFDEMNLNWPMYIANSDSILVICLKDDGELVGALIFFIGPYPHNVDETFADQITFFVQREYREHAAKMIQTSEKILKGYGCDFVVQSARWGDRFNSLLTTLEYEPLDVKYAKRL